MHSKIFLLLISLGWQENSDPQKSHLLVSPKPRPFGVLKTQTPKKLWPLGVLKIQTPKNSAFKQNSDSLLWFIKIYWAQRSKSQIIFQSLVASLKWQLA